MSLHIRAQFEPCDLWVGVYWKRYTEADYRVLALYVCLLPMAPIVITISRRNQVRVTG